MNKPEKTAPEDLENCRIGMVDKNLIEMNCFFIYFEPMVYE